MAAVNPTGLNMLAEIAAGRVPRDQAGRSWYRTWSNEVTAEVRALVDAGYLSTRFVDGQWLVTPKGEAALRTREKPNDQFSAAGGAVTDANDLVGWLHVQLDDDAETLDTLDSTALNGIESVAGHDVRAYVERGRARVDADRRLLDLHDQSGQRWTGFPRADRLINYCLHCQREAPCPTVRLLAVSHADRDGYREEWRP